MQCIVASRVKQVPACEGINSTPRTSNSNMTSKEVKCHCGAADSDAWISSCTKPDICDNFMATVLRSAYGEIKIACMSAGVSSSSDASTVSSSLTSKNGVVAGVAVAITTVFGALL
ncbi:hypothetical protein BGZ96_012823 [Linnemannia gamsii]|uniref:Extracellular membrane protein CFEM domain-containing protein n=1 Tax=Linnemannia gamsii TaxID=64522 RepID=A0ABQ7JPZ9_9FUNG|nr:hypothetical protein BGZ96_012823 [Linnemannia gamsii]